MGRRWGEVVRFEAWKRAGRTESGPLAVAWFCRKPIVSGLWLPTSAIPDFQSWQANTNGEGGALARQL